MYFRFITAGAVMAWLMLVFAAGANAGDAAEPAGAPQQSRRCDFGPTPGADNTPSTERQHAQRPVLPVVADPLGPQLQGVHDRVGELDQKLERQGELIRGALRWGVGPMIVLLAFCAASIGYFWLRFSRLSRSVERLRQLPAQAVAQREIPAAGGGDSLDPRGVFDPGAIDDDLHSLGLDGGLTPASIPRVQVCSGVIDCLVDGINESRRRNGNVETGYALVGRIDGDGSSRIITIRGLIDAGPGAKRSCGHVTFDRGYQQNELCLLQIIDGAVMHIGDAHLHPGAMDSCSDGDLQTDAANVRASRSQEMVFAIATVASARGHTRYGSSIWHSGLKLDFFYLGAASGYEYRAFRPEIVDGAALAAPDELRRFVKADPVRARLDFDNLRRLTDYTLTLNELPSQDGGVRPCVVMAHRTRGFKTLIAFSGEARQQPEVLVDTGDQISRFHSPYLDGELASVVWFTPIVLQVERELASRQRAGTGRNVPAGSGPARRATVRLGPAMGDCHGQI